MFDVLGKLQFHGQPLARVLLQALREADEAIAGARCDQLVSDALQLSEIRKLVDDKALAKSSAWRQFVGRVPTPNEPTQSGCIHTQRRGFSSRHSNALVERLPISKKVFTL